MTESGLSRMTGPATPRIEQPLYPLDRATRPPSRALVRHRYRVHFSVGVEVSPYDGYDSEVVTSRSDAHPMAKQVAITSLETGSACIARPLVRELYCPTGNAAKELTAGTFAWTFQQDATDEYSTARTVLRLQDVHPAAQSVSDAGLLTSAPATT